MGIGRGSSPRDTSSRVRRRSIEGHVWTWSGCGRREEGAEHEIGIDSGQGELSPHAPVDRSIKSFRFGQLDVSLSPTSTFDFILLRGSLVARVAHQAATNRAPLVHGALWSGQTEVRLRRRPRCCRPAESVRLPIAASGLGPSLRGQPLTSRRQRHSSSYRCCTRPRYGSDRDQRASESGDVRSEACIWEEAGVRKPGRSTAALSFASAVLATNESYPDAATVSLAFSSSFFPLLSLSFLQPPPSTPPSPSLSVFFSCQYILSGSPSFRLWPACPTTTCSLRLRTPQLHQAPTFI